MTVKELHHIMTFESSREISLCLLDKKTGVISHLMRFSSRLIGNYYDRDILEIDYSTDYVQVVITERKEV